MEIATIIMEKIISEGVRFLLSEISSYIKTTTQHQSSLNLPASAILSENILLNENLPSELKKYVEEYKHNLKCIIAGVAQQIEEQQYRKLDSDIEQMDLLPNERNKVTIIYASQKKISLSFQTLNVVIELFTRANDKIKQDIDNPKNNVNQNINLRLQNAILVYELLNFATCFVEDFNLKGRADINKIKYQVFSDIKSIEEKIERKIEKKYGMVSDETRNSTMEDVENYRIILENMKKRWDVLDKKIDDLEQQVGIYKTILPDLEMYRSSAEVQIEILILFAIMNIVEKNINLVKKLQHLKKDILVSFTPKDYYELIGRQA